MRQVGGFPSRRVPSSYKCINFHHYTQKCRFMGKEVREISRFYVAPPRELVLSVWRVSRTSLPKNLHPLVEANQSILGIASFLFWSRWLAAWSVQHQIIAFSLPSQLRWKWTGQRNGRRRRRTADLNRRALERFIWTPLLTCALLQIQDF